MLKYTVFAPAAHARTCKDYRETKQGIEMLPVKCDETWVTSDSILDERSVEFSVSFKRRKNRDTHSCCRETVREGKKIDSWRNRESW